MQLRQRGQLHFKRRTGAAGPAEKPSFILARLCYLSRHMSRMKLFFNCVLIAGWLQVQAQTPPPSPTTPAAPAIPAKPAIAWDSETKEYSAQPNEVSANFAFFLTNISTAGVVVNSARTSCGCTVAQLPSQPWNIAPGTGGPINVTVDLRGKSGTITKTVTVDTSDGQKQLTVRVNIPQPTGATPTNTPAFSVGNRAGNQQMALADRQAVFKGDCARCHVEPARGKLGKELYVTACGICHDAEHRATMVADLQAPKTPRDINYWQQWVAFGKSGTLMPAFATENGGPLTKEQVNSLVVYLNETFPKAPKQAP